MKMIHLTCFERALSWLCKGYLKFWCQAQQLWRVILVSNLRKKVCHPKNGRCLWECSECWTNQFFTSHITLVLTSMSLIMLSRLVMIKNHFQQFEWLYQLTEMLFEGWLELSLILLSSIKGQQPLQTFNLAWLIQSYRASTQWEDSSFGIHDD